ncbi:LIC10647 family lipoprotein [Leptospira borgpetersenii]|uniref:Uncharacterized protein n=1 Tax=Leptospira borgpetersenii serovar Ballum TaxID=280505 RepID=A0A0E3BKA1_LEPBO|nr:hypothetical protein [Leptospira borgpetersenii]EMO11163.1 hypothetical protein LEP1GSC137_0625 [Leptospira borgpetersenii str. Noumea 25]ALO24751.1 hypothetical protein LBBP_00391 [Leptospira borgpetersenii serovar Ballum]ALO28650.1 hypothetical protein LBBP_04554 [Leptospira borgpetersenii serovar Ballum]ANG99845.1 Uncharacterized protein LB4E_0321 [Leptospira borgpetersenii str. 4E]KGE22224.1 hypothetical protein IQ66_18120 [Leptospira borgpetersenii serovar Ballum]
MRLSDVQESRALISKRIIVLSIWICCTIHFSCRTLESFFETVILTGGVDSTELNFFTKYTPLENLIRTNAGFKTPKNNDLPVNHDPPKSVPFYTVDSIPRRLPGFPFTGYFKFLNYIAYGFTITSPRSFRGNLLNFPDDGRIYSNPIEQALYGLYPLSDPFARKAEYLYIDYQFYGTLYLGFLEFQNWNIGIGINLGYSIYDFDILERGFRVSTTRNQTRAIAGFKMLYEYNIGRFFEDTIFYNLYLYMELSSIGNREYSDRDIFTVGNFGKTPITQTMPTSNGEGYHDLYLTMNTFRIGIRKEIQLSRLTSDDLLRKESGPGIESAPPKPTEPVPPKI